LLLEFFDIFLKFFIDFHKGLILISLHRLRSLLKQLHNVPVFPAKGNARDFQS
jgi:hypothetical protein